MTKKTMSHSSSHKDYDHGDDRAQQAGTGARRNDRAARWHRTSAATKNMTKKSSFLSHFNDVTGKVNEESFSSPSTIAFNSEGAQLFCLVM